MNIKKIAEVNVDLDADDLKKVKNLKQLRKLNIFEHLSDEQKLNAENELAVSLGIQDSPDTSEQQF